MEFEEEISVFDGRIAWNFDGLILTNFDGPSFSLEILLRLLLCKTANMDCKISNSA